MSASSGGACAWGGAEMLPQAGSQAAEAAVAVWSLGEHHRTYIKLNLNERGSLEA